MQQQHADRHVERRGTGLAKATAYKPRVFTGDPPTESMNWTADTAGHETTTATLPASGETALPTEGVFQVKVKATNTAGDSDWSPAVDATCGAPGPIKGLKCTAAGDDSVTVVWDGAAGAERFEVQSTGIVAVGLADLFWEAGGRPSRGHPSIRRWTHAFDAPARGHLYLFGVRGVNSKGAGPEGTVKCRTPLSDMLSVECSANALVAASFSDPFEGTGLAPTQYTAVLTKAGSAQPTTAETRSNNAVFTGVEYGAQYTVALTAAYQAGWLQYTETDTVSCPAHTDNWNSPNFYDPDEDCNSDVPIVGPVLQNFCRQANAKLTMSNAWSQALGLSPALIDVDPVLLSRKCETNTAKTKRTCRETWTENIILLKNPGIDWKALRITDWSGPEEIMTNLGVITAIVGLAATGRWYFLLAAGVGVGSAAGVEVIAYRRDAAGKEYVRMYPVKAAAVADVAGTTLNVTGITNFLGCLSKYDFEPQVDTITVTKTYGTFTDERISTYHHCLPG